MTDIRNQASLWSGRTVVWFSCGAASAVAAKLVCERVPDALVVYHDLSESEHSDNARFLSDVERWIGVKILRTRHPKYGGDVNKVFEHQRYLVGRHGAPCTRALKREMGAKFCDWHDTQILGFTADEGSRIAAFEKHEPLLRMWWILRDAGLDKAACKETVTAAGIELPAMYGLGFENNNCLACVKSRSPKYWNRTRRYFPEAFKTRCQQERALGQPIIFRNMYLDELPPDDNSGADEHVECGTFCSPEPLEAAGVSRAERDRG